MNYQPETTHANDDGLEYAIIDGYWKYFHNGKWRTSEQGMEYLQHNLTPINYINRSTIQPQNCTGNEKATLSGGSCNYYMVRVEKPTTLSEPYTVECNDLIESLGLSFKEANIVKEIFRTANERTHGNGKDGNTPKRAAEKILFFAIRNAITNGVDIDKFTSEINLK